jgi:hypothetical protein
MSLLDATRCLANNSGTMVGGLSANKKLETLPRAAKSSNHDPSDHRSRRRAKWTRRPRQRRIRRHASDESKLKHDD